MERCRSLSIYLAKEHSLLSYIFEYCKFDQKLLDVVVAQSIDSNMKDDEGNSPLHLACKYALSFAIGFYSNYHQMQETLNGYRELPLHIACKSNINIENIKLVSSRIGNRTINTANSDGNTPLHIVCKSQNVYYQAGFWNRPSRILEI